MSDLGLLLGPGLDPTRNLRDKLTHAVKRARPSCQLRETVVDGNTRRAMGKREHRSATEGAQRRQVQGECGSTLLVIKQKQPGLVATGARLKSQQPHLRVSQQLISGEPGILAARACLEARRYANAHDDLRWAEDTGLPMTTLFIIRPTQSHRSSTEFRIGKSPSPEISCWDRCTDFRALAKPRLAQGFSRSRKKPCVVGVAGAVRRCRRFVPAIGPDTVCHSAIGPSTRLRSRE